MDSDKLPQFYYRDDALRIWEAIQSFTTEIAALHYRDDEDVELDEELLCFLQVEIFKQSKMYQSSQRGRQSSTKLERNWF